MNAKTLAVLGVVTAAAVGLAAWSINRQRPLTGDEAANGLLFDGLAAKVNDAAKMVITREGKSFTIEKRGEGWVLAEKGGYPAQFDKVKAALLGIAELSIVEPRTRDAAMYDRLGVEGAEKAGQGSTLVTVLDGSGATLASMLMGKESPGSMDRFYARRASDANSWLVKTAAGTTRLDVPSDAMMWIVRDLPSVPRDRVKSVTTTHPDGEAVVISKQKKEDKNYTVEGVPAGRELSQPTAGNAPAGGLAFMGFDDVQPAAAVDFGAVNAEGKPLATAATFETFEGMTVTATTIEKDGKVWAKFQAAYTEPAPAAPPPARKPPEAPADEQPKEVAVPPGKPPEELKKETEEFNRKAGGWAFQLADYRAKSFRTRMADLLKEEKKAEPTPAPPPDEQAPVDYPPPEGDDQAAPGDGG